MMSKYTQANAPPPQNDNDYYENVSRSQYTNSDDLLIEYRDCQLQTPRENNANYQPQEFEMHCKCVHPQRPRSKYSSEQNIVAANRNLGSMSRLDNASQFSLDRKPKKQHTYTCEQNQKILKRLERDASVKRMRSPEVINIHRGTSNVLYDGYGPESCAITSYAYDKDAIKCDDYGFMKAQGHKRTAERPSSQAKRRPAGDGMDSRLDDPELIFEVTDQIRECPCACDHVIYGPGYTNCLQEERFPPAPDVTRRLGATTPLGKADTPPYYRAASVTNSSSTQSSRVDLSTKHWWIIVTVLLLAAAAGVGVPIALKVSAGASLEERLEFASRLLQEVPLIDGHNDLPWNIRKFLHNRLKEFNFGEDLRNVSPWSTSAWSHTDLPRLKRGHVAAQFWAAYVPCDAQYKDAVQLTLEQIDIIRRLTELYHPSLTLCTSSDDIKTAYSKNQLCSLIGVEGGHSLAGSLAVLRSLYHIGVRYLTLTSTCNTPWADCSNTDLPGKKPEHGGLTPFGKTVIKEMNRLGMIVDLSHVSLRTMRDALAVSKAPVIFSHSSAHALCNSTRNIPDATLRKVALNKGVVMVSFYSRFLTCRDAATVSDAVAHINHIREVAGVDNVGLGAGYDGINFVPQGLEDVSSYPRLFAELIGTGKWTVDDLKKLAGLNFIRVMQEVENVRDEFKKAKVPPYEDVLIPRPKENNCSSVDN